MSCLAIFFLLLVAIPAQLQAVDDVVIKACARALDKASCTSALSTAPNRTDKKSVCVFALNLVSSAASEITKTLGSSADAAAQKAVTDCTSSYGSALDSIKQAQTAAASGQYSEVNTKISAAMSAATSCENGFKETSVQSPITDLSTKFSQLCSTVLAVTNA